MLVSEIVKRSNEIKSNQSELVSDMSCLIDYGNERNIEDVEEWLEEQKEGPYSIKILLEEYHKLEKEEENLLKIETK